MKKCISLFLAIIFAVNLFVLPVSAATTLKLGWKSATVGIGEVYTFTAKTNSAQKVKWTSSNEKIATVNGGKVTAKATGTAVIKASVGGISKEIKVTVKKAPSKISASNISVTTGRTAQIKVKLPSGTASKGITYKSSKTSIAKVDKNGVVTGIKKGTCSVAVTTFNGKTATVKVTVTDIRDIINSRELLYGIEGGNSPAFYGSTEHTTDEVIYLLESLGVKSYNFGINIPELMINPEEFIQDKYNETKDFIARLQKAGIEVKVCVGGFFVKTENGIEGIWERPPVRNTKKGSKYMDMLDMYYTSCKSIVAAFPEILLWEFGNSPNNIMLADGSGYYTPQQQCEIALDMMYYARKAVHETNPNAVSIMPNIDPRGGGFVWDGVCEVVDFLTLMYKNINNGKSISGSKNSDDYFDCLSWGAYHCFWEPSEEWVHYNNLAFEVAKKNGDGDKKVFIVFGYDDGGNDEWEKDNADWYETIFSYVKEMDYINCVSVFKLTAPPVNKPGEHFGLIRDVYGSFIPTRSAYVIQSIYGGKGDLQKFAAKKPVISFPYELDGLNWKPYIQGDLGNTWVPETIAGYATKIIVRCDKNIIDGDYVFSVSCVGNTYSESHEYSFNKGDPRITVSGNTITLDTRELGYLWTVGFTVKDKNINSGVKSITLDVAFDGTESKTLLPFLRTAVSNGLLPDSQAKKFKNQITRNDFDEFIMPLLERKLGYDFDISKILGSAYTSLKSGDKVTKEQAVKLFSKAASAMGYKGKTDSLISGSGTFTRGDCVMAMVGLFDLICGI